MRVLTVGTFDLLHPGHISFLKNCMKIAGVEYHGQTDSHNLTVGLNTDEFIEQFKGRPPVQTYDERATMLQNVRYVWDVRKNEGGEDLKVLIDKMTQFHRLGALVVGSDWAKKDYYKQTQLSQKYLDRKGILLIYVPYTEGVSTTLMKERILRYEAGNNDLHMVRWQGAVGEASGDSEGS